MKRRIAILILIIMTLSLFGCLHPIDPLKPEKDSSISIESSSEISESIAPEQSSSVPEVISSLPPEEEKSDVPPPDPSLKELKKGNPARTGSIHSTSFSIRELISFRCSSSGL